MLVVLICLGAGPAWLLASGTVSFEGNWRTASSQRTGVAPEPLDTPEALVQVYGARAFRWRGAFGIHTWLAVKPANAQTYTIFHVLGWRARHGGNSVVVQRGYPDREWYGSEPVLLAELRGEQASAAIPRITKAAAAYPFDNWYRIWPGPNSNTFIAYLARHAPELALDLPPNALGKDYPVPVPGDDGEAPSFLSTTPSGRGFQLSFEGALGVLVSPVEGWEVNVLGLGFGLDPDELALRLPGVGKLPLTPWREPETRPPYLRAPARRDAMIGH